MGDIGCDFVASALNHKPRHSAMDERVFISPAIHIRTEVRHRERSDFRKQLHIDRSRCRIEAGDRATHISNPKNISEIDLRCPPSPRDIDRRW